ncbi:surface polysaccharide O-acyltransferase-like enzyme [Massilia aurea]|uniref:Surface polysaccharide O-acyltransferase-like enzyme n=1 Tax=Massilia aurea TaxID=373040 RepID=A0A7W9X4Q5_9BURK|nr:acyltransferase family protein [Massilia aurea]MBB6136308.1 surface polysaccharide O-acyltransferase-like enzyme [Massilia aurea]
MQPSVPATSERLYFLDWVRILAFFVLIAYHVGMYYVSWDWHVKSPYASEAAEPFMLLSSPWRLTLLFFVAGVASHFMLGRLGPRMFLRRRSLRLLVPLLFGMLVIVPPQPYLEVVEKLGYTGDYLAFMRLYIVGYDGFCREDCLSLPTWNHLWFVLYLWCYTVVLAAGAALLGEARIAALARRVGALLDGWRLILLPVVFLGLVRILLLDRFPQDHSLTNDWYNHATYLPVFVLGALLARTPRIWATMTAQRWPALCLALAAWAGIVLWLLGPHETMTPHDIERWRTGMRFVYALCAWSAIIAACGFARCHLNRDGPARRYLTDAVFPVYIVHQTLIITMAHTFKPLQLAPGLEAVLLMILTACGSLALYEAVRRVPPMRPLFGLSRQARAVRPSGSVAGTAVPQ